MRLMRFDDFRHRWETVTVKICHSETVAALKGRIQRQLGVPPARQMLHFDGKLLRDDDNLDNLGIEAGCQLMMADFAIHSPSAWGLHHARASIYGAARGSHSEATRHCARSPTSEGPPLRPPGSVGRLGRGAGFLPPEPSTLPLVAGDPGVPPRTPREVVTLPPFLRSSEKAALKAAEEDSARRQKADEDAALAETEAWFFKVAPTLEHHFPGTIIAPRLAKERRERERAALERARSTLQGRLTLTEAQLTTPLG